MVAQSSTQACFSKQHLIIPNKKIRCFGLWNIFLTFSCIIAVHQVTAAVNGCIAASVHYLKNKIIKSSKFSLVRALLIIQYLFIETSLNFLFHICHAQGLCWIYRTAITELGVSTQSCIITKSIL